MAKMMEKFKISAASRASQRESADTLSASHRCSLSTLGQFDISPHPRTHPSPVRLCEMSWILVGSANCPPASSAEAKVRAGCRPVAGIRLARLEHRALNVHRRENWQQLDMPKLRTQRSAGDEEIRWNRGS